MWNHSYVLCCQVPQLWFELGSDNNVHSHRILWFFLSSNRINHAKILITRLSLQRDRCLHRTVFNRRKFKLSQNRYFFFFIIIIIVAWPPERKIVLNYITLVFHLIPWIIVCKNHCFFMPNNRLNHAKNQPNKFFSPTR